MERINTLFSLFHQVKKDSNDADQLRDTRNLTNSRQHSQYCSFQSDESCRLSEFLMDVYAGDKLNVAALGNQVPQLHLHHIVRFATDVAWPAPIWGKQAPQAYSPAAIEETRTRLGTAALDGYVATLDA